MKITKLLIILLFSGAILAPTWVQAAQGDGTGGGEGDGTNTGSNAPPGATATGPGDGVGPIAMTEPKLDQLFNWAEKTYPQFFPARQVSFKVIGYYARYYPTTDIYIGAKDNEVYVLGAPFGGMLKAGDFKTLVRDSGI